MKKLTKPKTRKQSIASLQRKADALLQKKYVPMYPNCLVCGKHCEVMHHFVPKSQSSFLRYDKRNLINLCNSCHARHHLSGDPFIVGAILVAKGQEWANQLETDRHILQKTNKGYLLEVIKELEEE